MTCSIQVLPHVHYRNSVNKFQHIMMKVFIATSYMYSLHCFALLWKCHSMKVIHIVVRSLDSQFKLDDPKGVVPLDMILTWEMLLGIYFLSKKLKTKISDLFQFKTNQHVKVMTTCLDRNCPCFVLCT